MMYYRRKVILGVLEQFENPILDIKIQKLIFLGLIEHNGKKVYDFIPNISGCYSFMLDKDLEIMAKKDMIKCHKNDSGRYWEKIDKNNYFEQLKDADKKKIISIKRKFANQSIQEILQYVFKKYPYYAINSEISNFLLSKTEIEKVWEERLALKKEGTELFTIGYEGISLEIYINRLIKNNIKILCDVRKNAFSMKRGFSKKELIIACNEVGIEYRHFPELGIESQKRKKLDNQNDYEELFREYEETVLEDFDNLVDLIYLLRVKKRIALTCFEAESHMCHRGRIGKNIESYSNGLYSPKHI